METNKLVAAFETELNLTEHGLAKLASEKEALIIDVSTDTGFKMARKERTEQNEILKRIDRLAIDGKKSVDAARTSLKDRVSAIYSKNVIAFEAEDARRKEESAREAREEAERVNRIRAEIETIRQFSVLLGGKGSAELQEIIEAVDMIDISENFAELTQEAMQVKKEVLMELNHALSASIQSEAMENERRALQKQREEQEEKARIIEVEARARERLNNLIMIPSAMFGKDSDAIKAKINSISIFEVTEKEFASLVDDAKASAVNVIAQLNAMLEQQLFIEESQKTQASLIEKHEKDEEVFDNAEDAIESAAKTGVGAYKREPVLELINIILDGNEFVEIENSNGQSIDIGRQSNNKGDSLITITITAKDIMSLAG